MQTNTKKLTALALLSALAYWVMFFGRVPVIMFLSYDPKDVIITIGGFMFGPLSAFAIAAVVSLVEMLTVSSTGPIGLVMNIISTCAFACVAAGIYKWKRNLVGAAVGLVAGALVMTTVMLLWNYLITPIYMGYPREAVAAMLVPVFLPFNLIKSGLNAAITMLLYKPIVTALRKARLLPALDASKPKSRLNLGVVLISSFVIVTGVLLILSFQGKL